MGGIALALVQADDAGVATLAFGLGGREFVEEDAHHVILVKAGGGQTAIVEGAGFAKGDHFLGDGAGGLGFGKGRGDALVLDQAAHQVGQHGVAMLAGATKFGGSFEVAHGLLDC